MIRPPWEKFAVINHQVEIEYVTVVRRGRGFLVAEIEMRQKYCEPLGWSGTELHIIASEYTRRDTYDWAAQASTVVFPRAIRGWDMVVPYRARYSMRVAFYRPQRRRRFAFVFRDEKWRTALMTKDKMWK